jgi:hypothetical protein
MTLEEAILNRVRQLPREKQEELLRIADGLTEAERPSKPYNPRTKEIRWISEHKHDYAGLWVSLDGDRLIAADPDGLTVYEAAKAEGIETPFVHRMATDDAPYFAGW